MRKPFESLSEDDFYGHRMDDCKTGCADDCPAKRSAEEANAAIEQDKVEYLSRLARFQLDCEKQLSLYEVRINQLTDEVNKLKRQLENYTSNYFT